MAQRVNGCHRHHRCGYTVQEAHAVLMAELRRHPATIVRRLRSLTIMKKTLS